MCIYSPAYRCFLLPAVLLLLNCYCNLVYAGDRTPANAAATLNPPNSELVRHYTPFTLKDDEFAIVMAEGLNTTFGLHIENAYGEMVLKSEQRDLFQRHRLFITVEQCTHCIAVTTTWNVNASQQVVIPEITQFQIQKSKQRYNIEKIIRTTLAAIHSNKPPSAQQLQSNIAETNQLWLSVGNSTEQLNSAFLIAHAIANDAEDSTAKILFETLLQTALQAGDFYTQGFVLLHLGSLEFYRGHYSTSEAYFKKARSKLPDIKNKELAQFLNANLAYSIGQLDNKMDRAQQSEKNLKIALQLYYELKRANYISITLNALGFSYRSRNRLEEAASYHALAFRYSLLTGSDMLTMQCLYHLAIDSALRGRFYYALELLNDAQTLNTSTPRRHWEAHILAAKARIFMELGMMQESERTYHQATQLYKQVNATADLKTVYLNQGRLYSLLGNFPQAKRYWELAEDKDQQFTGGKFKLRLLQAQINSELNQANYYEAVKQQLELIDQSKNTSDRFLQGENLSQLANLYLRLNDNEQALQTALQAITLSKDNRDQLTLAQSSYQAAQAAFALVNIALSTEHANSAIAQIENLRWSLQQDNLRREFFALQRSLYALKMRITMADNISNANNHLKALHVAETFKARTLYDSLRRQYASHPAATASSLSDKNNIQQLVEETLQQIRAFNTQPNKTGASLNFTQLQDYIKALPNDTAVLYFFIDEQDSLVWWISNSTINLIKLPENKLLQELVENSLKAALEPSMSVFSAANQKALFNAQMALSQKLLGKIADLDQFRHLVIIPDGPLHRVPFAALYNPKTQQPLLLTHTISYSLSLASDYWLQDNTKTRNNTSQLLLVGDPTFVNRDIQQQRDKALPQLPGTAKELAAIESLWPQDSEKLRLEGENASRSELLSHDLRKFSVLHFATHAQVNWRNPALTYLALAQSNVGNSNKLTSQEISQLRIDADLVVLSACETTAGKEILGEGPMGLSRAFFDAGSRRVVATLWPVADDSSAFLMEQFYTALLRDNKSSASALRAAQLAVARIPKWSHPYYWAGFGFYGKRNSWR